MAQENNKFIAHQETYDGGLLDKNTYYPSGNITIFPSSNATDGGKLFTEINGRNITINITDMNYVISPNPGGYDISKNGNMIDIQPGKALINGFEVLTNTVISYRFPNEDELYSGIKYAHKYGTTSEDEEAKDIFRPDNDDKKYALLCLHTIFDSMENLSGNVQVGDTWYCEGIHVCYPSTEEYEAHENEYLLLGGVTTNGDVKINDEKFNRINADKVLVRLEPDDETGVPPKQSTDLLTFINNFLHSYWVSKAGDHEYGNLTFRKKPNRYQNILFDYENEAALNDEIYAIKLGRYGIDDASDENPQYQKGYVNIKYSDNPSYSGYEKQTSVRPLGIFYKDNIKDNKNQIADGVANTFNAYIGYINGVSSNRPTYDVSRSEANTFVSRITATAERKNAYIGNNYGNGTLNSSSTGNFIWDSEGFNNKNAELKLQFSNSQCYFGFIDRDQTIQNDLVSISNSIKTSRNAKNNTSYFSIDLSAVKQQITLETYSQECYIKLRSDSDIANPTNWTNVLNIGHKNNTGKYDGAVEIDGKQWIHQYLVVGDFKDCEETDPTGADNKITTNPIGTDPSLIQVPDIAHGKARNIQDGDIYARQVWSAVYNDYAEMFEFSNIDDIEVGLLIAQDNKNPNHYTIADKYNTNIIGVISENPGYCTGKVSKDSAPVALIGRVKVKYDGPKIKSGDFVGLNKKIPGYVTKCWHFSRYRCGKVLKVLGDDCIEILVLL